MKADGRWAKSSPEARRRRIESNQKWRAKNAEKVRANGRAKYWEHRPKRLATARRYWERQMATRPEEYLAAALRRAKRYYRENAQMIAMKEQARLYGLTRQQVVEMHESQNGLCLVCNEPETLMLRGKLKRLSIDHCHRTGRVRGLLCSRCNLIAGQCKERPELLRRIAAWLESQQLS